MKQMKPNAAPFPQGRCSSEKMRRRERDMRLSLACLNRQKNRCLLVFSVLTHFADSVTLIPEKRRVRNAQRDYFLGSLVVEGDVLELSAMRFNREQRRHNYDAALHFLSEQLYVPLSTHKMSHKEADFLRIVQQIFRFSTRRHWAGGSDCQAMC